MSGSYTTGSSALPDIYAQARGLVQIYQAKHNACGISAMYHIAYAG